MIRYLAFEPALESHGVRANAQVRLDERKGAVFEADVRSLLQRVVDTRAKSLPKIVSVVGQNTVNANSPRTWTRGGKC